MRRFLACLLFVSLFLTAAGCGGSSTTAPPSLPPGGLKPNLTPTTLQPGLNKNQ